MTLCAKGLGSKMLFTGFSLFLRAAAQLETLPSSRTRHPTQGGDGFPQVPAGGGFSMSLLAPPAWHGVHGDAEFVDIQVAAARIEGRPAWRMKKKRIACWRMSTSACVSLRGPASVWSEVSLGELATAEPGRRAGDAQNKEREPCGLFGAGGTCLHGSLVLMGHAYS